MKLAHRMPACSAAVAARVRALLDAGCECAGPSAQITRRRIKGGNLTIHMQCTTCGHSKGTLKVAEVFSAKDLPAWDEEILRRYRATQVTRGPQVRAELELAETERRTQYSDWLDTSPVWHAMRARVHQRAGGTCEACLSAPSEHVHHVTYELGVLPPAWKLRAVCQDCHHRLHAGWTKDGSPILTRAGEPVINLAAFRVKPKPTPAERRIAAVLWARSLTPKSPRT